MESGCPGEWGLGLTALTSLFLGFFVYFKNKEGSLHKRWFFLCLATTGWALASNFTVQAPTIGLAFLSARIAQVVFSLIPALFLRFSLELLPDNRQNPGLLRWVDRAAGVWALLGLTPLLIKDIQTELSFRFYPEAGPLYGIFFLWFSSTFLLSLWILLKSYRVQVGYRRNQLRYMIIATIASLISFVSIIPLMFGIPIPPMGQGLLIFYALISYTIVRWRLMDISIVVKNTFIYASLYSILVGLFVVVVVFAGQFFLYGPQALDKRVLWMCVVALSIVTVLIRPLDSWLTRLTDRLLFQKKFEWQKTLKEASKGMTKVTSVERLLKLMAHFIGMRIRVLHVGIFYYSDQKYILKVSRGRERIAHETQMDRGDPLVGWLEEKKESLSMDEVRHWLQREKLFPHRTVLRRTLEQIGGTMEKFRIQVCIPAFSRSKMMGFLALGEKLSGDPYSQEDLDVLATLANEGAIALENAHLYEQLYQRMQQIENLYSREHSLFIHTAIALAAAVDARDPYTHGHTERCTAYAMTICDELGPLSEIISNSQFKDTLKIAALLHDIGKIGTPDEILGKKGKLTPKEFKKMQEHPIVGAIILQPIKGMEQVSTALKAHHERYDGAGYPDGLRGTEIPLLGRIISVADAFDTMTTDRPYRKRLSESDAVAEIEHCSGTQFDPIIVQGFLQAHRKGLLVNRPVEAADMLG